ncbi:amino acid synthesis family protein [Rubrimonas sp.]|uniref:amino acid synthesis family protein n=1 Tax=Rubrimonas sp. TaxID=2036015 RepID=UPI002FDCB507
MPEPAIRKIATHLEEIRHEGGAPLARPILRAWAAAVIANPFAGRFEPDIAGFMDDLKPLGLELSQRLLALLGGEPSAVESYGKGAIVGAEGESEHGALWHVPGGYAMRELLGGAKAIVPSAMKLGGVGASLDLPLGHREAAYVRSHFDAIEIRIPDAPRPREIVYALAMTMGGRPHARVGGLTVDQVTGEDGLR